jgi:hypothetical protein
MRTILVCTRSVTGRHLFVRSLKLLVEYFEVLEICVREPFLTIPEVLQYCHGYRASRPEHFRQPLKRFNVPDRQSFGALADS